MKQNKDKLNELKQKKWMTNCLSSITNSEILRNGDLQMKAPEPICLSQTDRKIELFTNNESLTKYLINKLSQK